jgi:hypothetical protein
MSQARRAGMASVVAPTIVPDRVVTFQINPGTLLQFLDARAEGGPRLKCFEGSVTLVTPGRSHESKALRLDHLTLRGKQKGIYRPQPRSRAFPMLMATEVLERLDDPETDDAAFHENCRTWARLVLVPRQHERE